jgi:RHS repeat-associated protein
MLMTNESGSVVWEGEFLPFGEELSITGSITNNLRFPGQYYDAETGLHYNYYRDYKPEIGRYLEADPILQPMINSSLSDSGCKKSKSLSWIVPGYLSKPLNLHPFIYASNNSINSKDIHGLFFREVGEWCAEFMACNRAKTAYCEAKYGESCRVKCATQFNNDEQKWKECEKRCALCHADCLTSSCPYNCDIPKIK